MSDAALVGPVEAAPIPTALMSPAKMRVLKFAVMAMGVLIAAGLVAVGYGMLTQASRLGKGRAASPAGGAIGVVPASTATYQAAIELSLPVGARIRTSSLSGRGIRGSGRSRSRS